MEAASRWRRRWSAGSTRMPSPLALESLNSGRRRPAQVPRHVQTRCCGASAGPGLNSGRRSDNQPLAQYPARTPLHIPTPTTGSLYGDQFPHSSGAPSLPEKEQATLRTSIVVLILVNILLGTALLAPSPSRATGDVPTRCCRGEGPDAYCCYMCCVRGPYCQQHSDCRDAD